MINRELLLRSHHCATGWKSRPCQSSWADKLRSPAQLTHFRAWLFWFSIRSQLLEQQTQPSWKKGLKHCFWLLQQFSQVKSIWPPKTDCMKDLFVVSDPCDGLFSDCLEPCWWCPTFQGMVLINKIFLLFHCGWIRLSTPWKGLKSSGAKFCSWFGGCV